MDYDLRATVRRTYRLPGKRLLLLEDTYEGGIESGDTVEVTLPGGRMHRAVLDGVAWGSAMSLENPPLTLIVQWADEPDPEPGAPVRGLVR